MVHDKSRLQLSGLWVLLLLLVFWLLVSWYIWSDDGTATLSGISVDDRTVLKALRGKSGLRVIYLQGASIGDSSIGVIAKLCPKVQELYLGLN